MLNFPGCLSRRVNIRKLARVLHLVDLLQLSHDVHSVQLLPVFITFNTSNKVLYALTIYTVSASATVAAIPIAARRSLRLVRLEIAVR